MPGTTPVTTSGGHGGYRLTPNQVKNYQRAKRVNVFVGKFDPDKPRCQYTVNSELAKHFSPQWKQELLEKNGVCVTAYADKDLSYHTEKICVRFIIQWMEQGGNDYTDNGAISYPQGHALRLRKLRALANYLQIGLLIERIDKDLAPIQRAEDRQAKKAAAIAAAKEERDNQPVFCELCKNHGHWDRRCPYLKEYRGRCYKCRFFGHKTGDCKAEPRELEVLPVATSSVPPSKTRRDEQAKWYEMKQAEMAAQVLSMPATALVPVSVPVESAERAPEEVPKAGAETAASPVPGPISDPVQSQTPKPDSSKPDSSKPDSSKPEPLPAPKPAEWQTVGTKVMAEDVPTAHIWTAARTVATLKNQFGKQKCMQLKRQNVRVDIVDGVEWLVVSTEGRIPKADFEANVAIK